jgi:hypothetical protein
MQRGNRAAASWFRRSENLMKPGRRTIPPDCWADHAAWNVVELLGRRGGAGRHWAGLFAHLPLRALTLLGASCYMAD